MLAVRRYDGAGIAVSPDGSTAYAARYGAVTEISAATNPVTGGISVSGGTAVLALSPIPAQPPSNERTP